MLMITRSDEGDLIHTLKVEGKLLGPWIAELESACNQSGFDSNRVLLDLARLKLRRRGGGTIAEGIDP